jgi:hypothetical protein
MDFGLRWAVMSLSVLNVMDARRCYSRDGTVLAEIGLIGLSLRT